MHILLSCFSPPFVDQLAELSLDKICHYYIFLNFLLSGKFATPLWVSAGTLLVCGGAGSDQSELLCIGNFRELSAGTADGPLDVIFFVRGILCSSKEYMSRRCSPVTARYAQELKK